MRIIFSVFFIFSLTMADNLLLLFKNKEYAKICNNRWIYIKQFRFKDEKKLSLVAYSCLKEHNLIPALDVAKNLTLTKEGRNNALYITSLFLIKEFLISYLRGDDIDFNSVHLPVIKEDLLGRVFEYVKNNRPKVHSFSCIFEIENKKYKIYPFKKSTNLVVEIYKNNNLIQRIRYW